MNSLKLSVKIADQAHELEQVCRLNHLTFSEEIQQHEKTASGLLIDKFHSENQYVICLDDSEIVGMIALRDKRPFSLDYKLNNIEDYLPPHKSLCEIRLLSVKPQYRGTKVFFVLLKEIFTQIIKKRYDYVVISGILSQQKLYRGVGFVPFGPLVGDVVKFQPMYSSPDFFLKSRHNALALNIKSKRVNALPGPVDIINVVAEEYRNLTESHRSDAFVCNYKKISYSLSTFVNAKNVQIFTGSGTLANEIMLAHISALSKRGLILSNGEFGDRILHQANCQKLNFVEYKVALGEELKIDLIKQILQQNTDIEWLYFVHCETSSGILNDFNEILKISVQKNILVFVDCVSTFGIIPLDLSKVYMASASSGKAIGAYSGLSMVFFNNLLAEKKGSIPVYLDIWHYVKKNGIPFTLNSNSLYALGAALEIMDVKSKYTKTKEKSLWIKTQLSLLNISIKSLDDKLMHPAIISVKLPDFINSSAFGKSLEDNNVLVNYNSDYLLQQNMIQICLFSELIDGDVEYILSVVTELTKSFNTIP